MFKSFNSKSKALNFLVPKTLNCAIEFVLTKKNDKKIYETCERLFYSRNNNSDLTQDTVFFKSEFKMGSKFKLIFNIRKNFTTLGPKEVQGNFEETLTARPSESFVLLVIMLCFTIIATAFVVCYCTSKNQKKHYTGVPADVVRL